MAAFKAELPDELIKEFENLYGNTDKMLKEMVKAGAKVVEKNVKNNVPSSWLKSDIMQKIKVTKAYNTANGETACKIALYGYFKNKDGRIVPAPLVANVTEYGRSGAKYPKHPFLRKSFDAKQIETAMLKVQKKYIDV